MWFLLLIRALYAIDYIERMQCQVSFGSSRVMTNFTWSTLRGMSSLKKLLFTSARKRSRNC